MKQVYADSIVKAKSYYDDFDDVIHDLAHSRRDAENAKALAKELGYGDLDFLELCAMWHDVARTQGKEPHEEAGALMLKEDLLNRGASAELAERAYEAIRFHKSTAKPVTIEGKIIRDADKLDIFFVPRWQKAAKAGWPQYCIDDLKRTIDGLHRYPDVFTYGSSKEKYKKVLPDFLKFVEASKILD